MASNRTVHPSRAEGRINKLTGLSHVLKKLVEAVGNKAVGRIGGGKTIKS